MDEEHCNTLSLQQLYFLEKKLWARNLYIHLCSVGANLFQAPLLVKEPFSTNIFLKITQF